MDSTVLGFSQAKPRSWILPSWGLFRPAKPRSWSPHPALDRCSTGAQIKAGSSDWTHICLGAQIQDGSSDRIHILPKASFTSAKQSKHFSTKPHSMGAETQPWSPHPDAGAQVEAGSSDWIHIDNEAVPEHLLHELSLKTHFATGV